MPVVGDVTYETFTSYPVGYRVVRGQTVSGALREVFYSEDARLGISPLFTPASGPPVWVILEGSAATVSPSELRFTLEARVDTPSIEQKIELFNYVTQSYEELDTRIATIEDSIVEILVSGDPSRFIDPATLEMKAQLTWEPAGPLAPSGWSAGIDQTVWTVLP